MDKPIYDFVNKSDNSSLENYELKLRESINLVSDQINSYNKWMFILVVVYYLINSSKLNDGLSFEGISIKDIKTLNEATPALIAILYLFYLKLLFYRNELEENISFIFAKIYNVDFNKENNFRIIKPLIRLTIPYRPIYELLEVKSLDEGCLTMIIKFIFIGTPIAFIQLIPIFFIIKGIAFNIENNWENSFGKISIIMSIWAISLVVILFLSKIFKTIKNE